MSAGRAVDDGLQEALVEVLLPEVGGGWAGEEPVPDRVALCAAVWARGLNVVACLMEPGRRPDTVRHEGLEEGEGLAVLVAPQVLVEGGGVDLLARHADALCCISTQSSLPRHLEVVREKGRGGGRKRVALTGVGDEGEAVVESPAYSAKRHDRRSERSLDRAPRARGL